MTVDQETIGAFVDGELNEIDRRRIEAAIAADPALAEQIEAERRLRAMLKARFDPVAAEPVPDRLVAAAVRDGAKVTPLRTRTSWNAPHWAAIAATLAVGVVAGLQFRAPSDITGRNGAMMASGSLNHALETQLASSQAPGDAARIGLTFKAQDGAWCRTFEQKTLSGIACRSGQGWTLRRTESGGAETGEYRQAGSGDMAAAAQEMAAAAPLDADQEKALVAKGWK